MFAGRRGNDVDAGLQNVDAFFQHNVGLAATEHAAKQPLEIGPNGLQTLREQPPAVDVDPLDDADQCLLGVYQILVLTVERLMTFLESVDFVERRHVDCAHIADAAAQIRNFPIHLVALPLCLFGLRQIFQLGQLNSVVFEHALGEAIAFQTCAVRLQLALVPILLQLLPLLSQLSQLVLAARPLPVDRLQLLLVQLQLPLLCFAIQGQFRQRRVRLENRAFRLQQPRFGRDQLGTRF